MPPSFEMPTLAGLLSEAERPRAAPAGRTWPYYLPIAAGAASSALLLASILDTPQWQSQPWPLWIAGAALLLAAVGGSSAFVSAIVVVLACERSDGRRGAARLATWLARRGATGRRARAGRAAACTTSARDRRAPAPRAVATRPADWSVHFEVSLGRRGGGPLRLWGSVWLWLDEPRRGVVQTSGWRIESANGLGPPLATARGTGARVRFLAELSAPECDRLAALASHVATAGVRPGVREQPGSDRFRAVVRRRDRAATVLHDRPGAASLHAGAGARLQRLLLAVAERTSGFREERAALAGP